MDLELVRWQELVRRAGSARRARTWLARDEWWRVVHDVYAPLSLPDEPVVRAHALRLVLPPHVAVSHRSALWLLGLDVDAGVLHVTAPRGHRVAARPRVQPHSARLSDDELCEVGGLLVVSAARAVVDVARSEPLVEGVVVGDAALRAGVADQPAVEAAVRRSAGLRGVERARQVLPHLEPRSESPQETRLRMRFVLGGLPRPQAQVDVYDDEGHVARLDLALGGVGIEYDGRAQRLEQVHFTEDRRRHNRLVDLGVEVRRFTAADVFVRPAEAVCADLRRALEVAAGRDRSRVRSGPDTLRAPRYRPLQVLSQQRTAA